MRRLLILLYMAATVLLVTSCTGDEARGRQALENLKEKIAQGQVENIGLLSTALSDEEQAVLLSILGETELSQILKDESAQYGTPDDIIIITLQNGNKEFIDYFYMDAESFTFYLRTKTPWVIVISNEHLEQWLREQV